MDFMRTLLAYMAATLLVAVESTATPGPEPTPSPIPEGMTTPAIVETITEAPTATAEPTVSVTPVPVPTITANTKAYHNLAQGAKGAEVRKLQEKLIELGYLPEGAADGAYGGQTRNAARRFQYYNSLTVDGVAGRITQTNLFENPDIVPMPTSTPSPTPTAEPTSTPSPTTTAEPTGTPEPTPTAEPAETSVPEAAETAENTEAPSGATEAPAEATEAPAKETEAPAEEPEAPEEEPIEPAEEPEAPEEEPIEPAEEPEAPEEEPIVPAEEPEAPEEELVVPEEEPVVPAAETEAPVKETEAPAAETEAPVEETEAPAAETEAPAAETEVPAEEQNGTAEAGDAKDQDIVEDVNLDDTYQEINANVVLNDSGAPMEWLALEDGVSVKRKPRVQEREGNFRVSLADVVQCVKEWELTDDENTVVLQAAGYTLGLYNESAGVAATVDGIEQEITPQDYDFNAEGNFIDAAFLCRVLKGTCEWDGEEFTLMLRIPSKATD